MVERKLRDDMRHIVGTPDLVYDDDGEVCIRDYKTGMNPSPARESAQLHLYAHLVSGVGLVPIWGEIDRLRGSPERLPIEPNLVNEIVLRATRARRTVLSHSTEASTPEICARCAYRFVCPQAKSVDAEGTKNICGMVTDVIGNAEEQVLAVAISTDDSTVIVGGLEGRDISVEVGVRVLARGLRTGSSTTGLMADWASVIVTEREVVSAIQSTVD